MNKTKRVAHLKQKKNKMRLEAKEQAQVKASK
jgi:hypothetical protein